MLFSATQQTFPMFIADQTTATALRAILAYQPGLATSGLDVRLEGHSIAIEGTVASERHRQTLLDIVHDFTAIQIVCLVTVRNTPEGDGAAGRLSS
ncbi:BON domain-containing protein [Neorhizobium sp. JUb45]|uniref:BON domain-containing protein n=1 Tax=Neorhizobium sp. JUb45 TaxID=2485113 RepID=UPI00104B9B6A|nr:BON domain-containing protein [Neorhizobium sp. JUb45]TCQ95824.1 hypothetical protein EDF70_12030 [Neorhizobium sp. JUb45]